MDDADILARTLFGEARTEGIEGIEAVACVIMNRYKAHKWYTGYVMVNGKKYPSIAQTCLKKRQFSCWNKNDPNLEIIKNINIQDAVFAQCLEVAKSAINGQLKDWTGGAIYYHSRKTKPVWARGKYPCYALNNYLFYRDD